MSRSAASELRTVHRQDRQKPVAREYASPAEGRVLVGACCRLELPPEGPYVTLNALEVEREYGRSQGCEFCGERILDTGGLPLETLEDDR